MSHSLYAASGIKKAKTISCVYAAVSLWYPHVSHYMLMKFSMYSKRDAQRSSRVESLCVCARDGWIWSQYLPCGINLACERERNFCIIIVNESHAYVINFLLAFAKRFYSIVLWRNNDVDDSLYEVLIDFCAIKCCLNF